MVPGILAIVGVVLLVAGIVKRQAPWSRQAMIIGVLALVAAFLLGGGLQGIRDGWRSYH